MAYLGHTTVTIDTNILVRFFVADDIEQHKKATELLNQIDKLVIPTTVLDNATIFITFDKKAVKVLQKRGYQAQLLT